MDCPKQHTKKRKVMDFHIGYDDDDEYMMEINPVHLVERGSKLFADMMKSINYSGCQTIDESKTIIGFLTRKYGRNGDILPYARVLCRNAGLLTSETLRLILSSKFPVLEHLLYKSTYCRQSNVMNPMFSKDDLVVLFLTTYEYGGTHVPLGVFLMEKLLNGTGLFAKHRILWHAKNMNAMGTLVWYYNMSRNGRIPEMLETIHEPTLDSLFTLMLECYTYTQIIMPFLAHYGINSKPRDCKCTRLRTYTQAVGESNSSIVPITQSMDALLPIYPELTDGDRYLEYPANVLWIHSVISTAVFNKNTLKQPRSKGDLEKELETFRYHFRWAGVCRLGPVSMLQDSVSTNQYPPLVKPTLLAQCTRILHTGPSQSRKRKAEVMMSAMITTEPDITDID